MNNMSTRSNIKLIDNCGSILLYKHHDGYPDTEHGIIEFLTPFIQKSMKSAEWLAEMLIKDTECKASSALHGDIEYYYEVMVETNKIHVYKTAWDSDDKELEGTFTVGEIIAK
jgi:hypothetical protein